MVIIIVSLVMGMIVGAVGLMDKMYPNDIKLRYGEWECTDTQKVRFHDKRSLKASSKYIIDECIQWSKK